MPAHFEQLMIQLVCNSYHHTHTNLRQNNSERKKYNGPH